MENNFERDIEAEYDFEEAYYAHIAQTNNFLIIPIPDPDGSYLTEEEKFLLKKNAVEEDKVVLYQIELDNGYVVFGDNLPTIGFIPITGGKEDYQS